MFPISNAPDEKNCNLKLDQPPPSPAIRPKAQGRGAQTRSKRGDVTQDALLPFPRAIHTPDPPPRPHTHARQQEAPHVCPMTQR